MIKVNPILFMLLVLTISVGFTTLDFIKYKSEVKGNKSGSVPIQYDTLCQVIIFRDREGKSYITTKYKPGEYIDMCEPLGIIVREADRMCNVPKKVIPSNAIPKRVQYSGHINGY